METPPPDNASLDSLVAIYVRVEEDEGSADCINSTEGSHKGHFPRNKKSTYGIKLTPSEHQKKLLSTLTLFSSDRKGLWWKEIARGYHKKKIWTVQAKNNAKIKTVIQKKQI